MAKNVAVIAFNPVNGMGLFQYLEAFFENGIQYKVYAVAEGKEIKTNSGIALMADDVIANLISKVNDYDAVVFACGDAMIKFRENADKQYNKDMMAVLSKFNEEGKMIIGHCAAAMIFDALGIADGKKVAVHPYGKPAIQKGIATDELIEINGNLYTAQTENALNVLIPKLLEVLK